MHEASPVEDASASGWTALARGEWAHARDAFENALAHGEAPEALEGLSWAAWWLEDIDACLDARERAYHAHRRADDGRGAARMALWLADDHQWFRGAAAVADGWFRRATRLLDELEPCPEHGWLMVFDAHAALDRGDLDEARALAARAQESGRTHGAVDLEMFAVATDGVAQIEQGAVADGLRCLDEAVAAALAGEFENLAPAAWACCLLLAACERVRDYARGAQWCQKVEEFSRRMDAQFVLGVCRAHYGAILGWHGSWADAEAQLVTALAQLTGEQRTWRTEALVRFAELRRRQGHLEEAAARFEEALPHPLAHRGLAAISLDRGEPVAARDLLERALRRIPPTHSTHRADVLELLVRVHAVRGDPDAAADCLAELRAVAAAVDTEPLRAAVSVAEGLLAAAVDDHERACDHFEDAVDAFARCRAPLEVAYARLDLAGALRALGRVSAAKREGELAQASLEELGAAIGADRARALLAELSAESTAGGGAGGPLTARQVDVIRLVAEGLSDAAIAERLTLSEHTVHRHVANIYTRLGCSSRAAAVAIAGRLGLL